MPEPAPRNPPLPVVQTFLSCTQIFQDRTSGTLILIGPTMFVPAPQYPCHARLSFFAEFTGCHGAYLASLVLRDSKDQIVWGFTGTDPFEQEDPLIPHRHTFVDMKVAVPRPGHYVIGLLLNEEEAAQRRITFGTA
jgi:hypothetical protein